MQFIASRLSKDTYISLMNQYAPFYKAGEFPELNRRIIIEEYEKAKSYMQAAGLYNGWIQESGGMERFAGVNIKPTSDIAKID
jgi:putative pyruvate formate lyase activating enzyme